MTSLMRQNSENFGVKLAIAVQKKRQGFHQFDTFGWFLWSAVHGVVMMVLIITKGCYGPLSGPDQEKPQLLLRRGDPTAS